MGIRQRLLAASIAMAGASPAQAAEAALGGFPATVYRLAETDDAPLPIPAMAVEEVRVGGLRVVMETTTLSDVVNRFGGTVRHTGDAGQSVYWLCYHVEGGAEADVVLWFVSDGAMGGRERAVTLLAQERLRGSLGEEECGSVLLYPAEIDFSLPPVGSRRAAVLERFGSPGGLQDDRSYLMYGSETDADHQGFTTLQTVYFRVRDGQVDAVAVSQVTVE